MTLIERDRPAAQPRLEASRLQTLAASPLAAPAAAIGLVTLSTIVAAIVTPTVPADAAGVIYLVGVLGVSSLCGLWWGLGTSVASALAYNFFFLPPTHTFTINTSSDWAALAAFVLTAVVTSNLASRARRERDEAARRAAEARLSEQFATLVADADDMATVLPTLASQASRALGASDGVIHRGAPSPPERRGSVLTLNFNGRWMGELRLIEVPSGALEAPAADRIARSLAGLIALGEERERRQRQQVQAEELSRSNELKTALLRAVSHDMRSPLMAITTAAGGLRYAELAEDERELLETITDQSERMSRMIENLLDLSKLQAGAVSARADWLDPRELVEASADELQRRQPDGHPFRLDFAPDLPLVRGDASQLQRVIVNLLENARKFSPPASPVRAEVARAGSWLEIAVTDSGPGVPADEAERIFEPFYRAPGGRDLPGSGLGLAIARGLADANGCRLTVAAAEGGGARFTLSLPVPAGGKPT
jgi:two-component system, OmpR family, sensor histidine kinase KdpD